MIFVSIAESAQLRTYRANSGLIISGKPCFYKLKKEWPQTIGLRPFLIDDMASGCCLLSFWLRKPTKSVGVLR
jgi:hypothetical protein